MLLGEVKSVNSTERHVEPPTPLSGLPPVISLSGPSGVGKTHIARGLVQRWQETHGIECAEYFAASDFRHLLIDAIKNNSVADFRQRVRSRSLLVIDGLDRLPKDNYLQEEVRATIDTLENRAGTLVVTANQAASTLRNLSADVRSRFSAGLSLELHLPGSSAKERIVRLAASALGLPLGEIAAANLAAGIEGTAADLFCALFELAANRSLRGSDLERIDKYLALRSQRRPTMHTILQAVSKYCAVPQKLLKSSSRRQSIVQARSIAIYLARELGGQSYERIGTGLGGRDHTTVIHSHRKIERQISNDHLMREAVNELKQLLAVSCRVGSS
jgi:chromosomal replication initiator protein